MIDKKDEIKDEFYEKFEKLIEKIFYVKTQKREYSGLKLISVDRKGSPIRFLTFENKEGFTPKILAFAPEEIKQYEVKE